MSFLAKAIQWHRNQAEWHLDAARAAARDAAWDAARAAERKWQGEHLLGLLGEEV